MKRPDSGFTLVELMMAVAVLGVLLAVAVPLYSDYQTRARVAQVLTAIDSLRTVFHAEYEVEGGIPTFAPGKEGEIPPELARLPIGPELLRFDYLSEHLVQSSHHYGPFEGKDIPYLVLKANDATQSRYLAALAHALPHSSYAWMIEPTVMIVPLLDAKARHDTVVNAKQNLPVVKPPAQPTALTCPPAGEPTKTELVNGTCLVACPSGLLRGTDGRCHTSVPATALTCPPAGEPTKTELVNGTCLVACPSGLLRGTDGRCHTSVPAQPATQPSGVSQGVTAQGGSTPLVPSPGISAQISKLQPYDDCRAHVLANHPHGHAWGLLRQCNRYLH